MQAHKMLWGQIIVKLSARFGCQLFIFLLICLAHAENVPIFIEVISSALCKKILVDT